jgi:hypothetical protein
VQWLIASLFWLAITALYGAQLWLIAQQPGEALNVYRILVWQMPFYLAWIPVTVLLWRAVERWPPDRIGVTPFVLLHVGGWISVTVMHALFVSAVGVALSGPMNETFMQSVLAQTRSRIYIELIIYSGVLAAGHVFVLYDRWRDQADKASRLEGELAAATLSALRAQLHPHLLFNSLHAVASLVRESKNADAVRLIAGMSDLLRRMLDTDRVWHTLADEIALARTFLDIQHVRFEERLQVRFDVPADCLPLMVPTLVLQPLVENSLRHGFANKLGVGHLEIRARRTATLLTLEVDDDGEAASGDTARDGVGLRNLEARLRTLYRGGATLEAGARAGSGFRVVVQMPAAPQA